MPREIVGAVTAHRMPRQCIAVRADSLGRATVARWAVNCAREHRVIWVGAHRPSRISGMLAPQARDHLGAEVDCLVIELDPGFSPDALAIAVGWVRGGGVLCLLVETSDGRSYATRLQHFLNQPPFDGVRDASTAALPLPRVLVEPGKLVLTAEQKRLFEELQGLVDRPNRQCAVLQASRGRGKSTLLGALLARWATHHGETVGVSARSRQGAATLLRAAAGFVAPGAPRLPDYRSPESWLASPVRPEILLVDEAAALPPPQLLRLLAAARCCILASTPSGFEGSGRHFDLRLRETLENAGWQVGEYRLSRAVRWAPDDPLEPWLNELLLLEAPAPPTWIGRDRRELDLDAAIGGVEWWTGPELASSPSNLQAVVGLLYHTHYRTRPSDLRRWLDDPRLRFARVLADGQPLGVLVVAHEPGLDPETTDAVFAGERRPQGRFLPGILATQRADAFAGTTCWRILRIAVHPELRRRGIGRSLLAAAEVAASAAGAGVIGASFGARADLLAFWFGCGYAPLHIGFQREPVSGRHAALVVRALNEAAGEPLEFRRRRFRADWEIWRDGPLRGLDAELARAIAARLPDVRRVDRAEDRESVHAFARRQRSFEWSLPALRRRFRDPGPGSAEPVQPEVAWMHRVLFGSGSWPELAAEAGTSGRAGVLRRLRSLIAEWEAAGG